MVFYVFLGLLRYYAADVQESSPTCQIVRPARTISSARANSEFAPCELGVRTGRTFWVSQAALQSHP